jgi:hypothetical protein
MGFAGAISALPRPEPAMFASGLTMLVMALAFNILAGLDTRMVLGVSTWLKPTKFAVSLGVHLLTIAFLWSWLLPRIRDGVGGTIIIRLLIATSLFELIYIAYQGALGSGSHYNLATGFSIVMYQLMGVGATILVGATAAAGVAVLVVREAGDGRAMRRAVGFGLVLSGALGLLTGVMLSINGGHFVGIPSAESVVWPFFGWSREVGDLRVSHFIGLHAVQVMPLIGLVAITWKRERAGAIISASALAILAACLATAWQAWSGLPLV